MSSPGYALARTLTRTRMTLRRTALPLTVGLTTGLVAIHHQRPMRFDSYSAAATSQTRPLSSEREGSKRKELLDAETIKQLSGGSLSGML